MQLQIYIHSSSISGIVSCNSSRGFIEFQFFLEKLYIQSKIKVNPQVDSWRFIPQNHSSPVLHFANLSCLPKLWYLSCSPAGPLCFVWVFSACPPVHQLFPAESWFNHWHQLVCFFFLKTFFFLKALLSSVLK